MTQFKSIKIKILEGDVGLLTLDRPEKGNAQNFETWEELPTGLAALQAQGTRAIVLNGSGKNFCTGIDLSVLGGDLLKPKDASTCQGRSRLEFISFVRVLQDAMTACELCNCPIIAAIHGACFGAGVDLITVCDIRYATSDARLCVKEVDLGLAADMGVLARLPGIVGDGIARDLALTAREISGEEALNMHLVSQVFSSPEELLNGALATAKLVAAKSPLALAGTKRLLLKQRGRTVEEGLEAVSVWNAAMLPGSHDILEAFAAKAGRRAPRFSKL